MDPKIIEQILKDALALDEVYVSGENAHFNVIAVSDKFDGVSRVKQQQMIYAPLMEYISSSAIHALNIKTFTVAKWQREKIFNL